MNKIYRFSPISSKEELMQAILYITNKTTELCKKITGSKYPISSLTVFTHYPTEFERLKEIVSEIGEFHHENNGPFVKLHEPIKLENNNLTLLRIRQPDPYRMQVGCDDFEIKDYLDFKNKFLNDNHHNLRLIERPDCEMIEFFDPDFDVLAYVLNKPL